MQIKIIVGTVAFMLTMIVFGFVSLREPARLEQYTAALTGRAIENGANTFMDTCATCHGVNGDAKACFDAAGNTIGCIGLPLNNAALLCGDRSTRMDQLNWSGTKEQFLRATVYSGRAGSAMPTWSQDLGGPLQQNEIEDVVQFVMNWESEELCAAPTPVPVNWTTFADLPEGVPAGGEALYTSLGCVGCHGDINAPDTNLVGPHLSTLWQEGGSRIDGYTAPEYVFESILNPAIFLAKGCPTGDCANAMTANFGTRMTEQDMADIISFILQER